MKHVIDVMYWPMTIFLMAICLKEARADLSVPVSEPLLRAMIDEVDRSKSELKLDDLPRPYLVVYHVEDRIGLSMEASFGGLLQSKTQRSRSAICRVRVGDMTLDNTNVGRGGGTRGTLPLDDDYTAIRHTLWRLTDQEYMQGVEILTRKQAYLQDKLNEDRPADYTAAKAVKQMNPAASLIFNQQEWTTNVERLSARFKRHASIQNARVSFFAGAVNAYSVNSEGTQLREGDTGILIGISASVQAEDGMFLSDSLAYIAEQFDELASVDDILSDIDDMCAKLTTLSNAPTLDQYTGPVFFDAPAAGRVFGSLLSHGVCAQPKPLGAGSSWDERSLEKKIGLRILPRSFEVYDDPTNRMYKDEALVGAYNFDDEGTPSRHVSVIEKGILKNMLAGRAPTRKVVGTTGHARGAQIGDPRATIGCLYIRDKQAVSTDELKTELISVAEEEGLAFGLRIETCQAGGWRQPGKPIYAYKVYVDDGHEELVRGLEFLQVPVRAMKRIVAASDEYAVSNSLSPVSTSIISPAVLFEELELRKPEKELDKQPILQPPHLRGK